MRNVLVIAWYFPPDGGPGTQRGAKFCRYLPGCGWQPLVLTRDARMLHARWSPEDRGLLDELGPNVRIVRCAALNQFTGDWIQAALDQITELVRAQPVEVVLITMSPFELAALGRRISTTLRLPVVYDLRDPWALDGVPGYRGRRGWRRVFDDMAATLASAAGVIANTPDSRRAMLQAFPGLREASVTAIPNGFDAADFDAFPAAAPPNAGEFRLVHTGSFLSECLYEYEGLRGHVRRWLRYRPEPLDPTGRTPLHLLRAIKRLRMTGHPLGKRIRLVHVGQADPATQRCVHESGVADAVEYVGYLSHAESVARLAAADALFLHLHGLPPGHRSLIVPGKTYEYLASGRPILGCLPTGDARELVEQSGRGFCCDPCDSEAIARSLAALDAAGRFTIGSCAHEPALRRFDRQALTAELAEFLERTAAPRAALTGAAVPA